MFIFLIFLLAFARLCFFVWGCLVVGGCSRSRRIYFWCVFWVLWWLLHGLRGICFWLRHMVFLLVLFCELYVGYASFLWYLMGGCVLPGSLWHCNLYKVLRNILDRDNLLLQVLWGQFDYHESQQYVVSSLRIKP